MSGQQEAPEKLRFKGKQRTRQVWGNWLEPGDIITEGCLVAALSEEPDFEIVGSKKTRTRKKTTRKRRSRKSTKKETKPPEPERKHDAGEDDEG